MITIEEFLNKKNIVGMTELIAPIMIEFAKLHVTEALIQASQQATIQYNYYGNTGTECYDESVDKDSILNAYPLNKIK